MIKQNNKLVNYDSIYANKINGNCYNISYPLDVIISNIKCIHLRSLEIPISICNIRSPYNTFTYIIKTISNVTTTHTIQLQDKVYNSIYTLIADINTLMVLNIQPKLQTNEIAPIFTVSTSELNKLIMTVLTNSTTVTIQNTGIMFYYLGFNNPIITVSNVLLQKTTIYTFQNMYNLSIDTYYNLTLNNISSVSKNNHNFSQIINYQLIPLAILYIIIQNLVIIVRV